jgi:hypothetical protein
VGWQVQVVVVVKVETGKERCEKISSSGCSAALLVDAALS